MLLLTPARMARVLTIDLNGEAVAYPYETLEEIGAANDTFGGEAVVISGKQAWFLPWTAPLPPADAMWALLWPSRERSTSPDVCI